MTKSLNLLSIAFKLLMAFERRIKAMKFIALGTEERGQKIDFLKSAIRKIFPHNLTVFMFIHRDLLFYVLLQSGSGAKKAQHWNHRKKWELHNS